MAIKFIENKKESIEMEFDDKILPNIIRGDLVEHNIDAYCYEPHPLIPGYRLHIEADDAIKELKNSVKRVEKNWNEFGKALIKAVGK